jgi:hypothetical protein
MTTPPRPAERPAGDRPGGPGGHQRHARAMWTLVLRRFRAHLHTRLPDITSEDTDGRTP